MFLNQWFLNTEIIICVSAYRPPQYLEYMKESFLSGTECGTDHNLVLVKMKQCIKFVKTGKTMVEKK